MCRNTYTISEKAFFWLFIFKNKKFKIHWKKLRFFLVLQLPHIENEFLVMSWTSFPKEFKNVCERIAEVFGMKMKPTLATLNINKPHVPKKPLPGGGMAEGVIIEFPEHENILYFTGLDYSKVRVNQITDTIMIQANLLEKIELD